MSSPTNPIAPATTGAQATGSSNRAALKKATASLAALAVIAGVAAGVLMWKGGIANMSNRTLCYVGMAESGVAGVALVAAGALGVVLKHTQEEPVLDISDTESRTAYLERNENLDALTETQRQAMVNHIINHKLVNYANMLVLNDLNGVDSSLSKEAFYEKYLQDIDGFAGLDDGVRIMFTNKVQSNLQQYAGRLVGFESEFIERLSDEFKAAYLAAERAGLDDMAPRVRNEFVTYILGKTDDEHMEKITNLGWVQLGNADKRVVNKLATRFPDEERQIRAELHFAETGEELAGYLSKKDAEGKREMLSKMNSNHVLLVQKGSGDTVKVFATAIVEQGGQPEEKFSRLFCGKKKLFTEWVMERRGTGQMCPIAFFLTGLGKRGAAAVRHSLA